MNTQLDAYEWALRFADAGHPVFPLHSQRNGTCTCVAGKCSSPAKHPRTADGLRSATTDLTELELWSRAFPATNWGVRCDNLVVFDCDDALSVQALLDLKNSYGEPPAFTVTTSRGMHLYYRGREDVRLRPWAGKVPGLHIDLRTGPSYVVLPGSRHISGSLYEPAGDIQAVAPLPDWAVPIATGALLKGGRAGTARALRDELESPASAGSRHDWTTRVCGLLARLLGNYRELYDAAVASAVSRLPDVADFPEAEWQRVRNDIWDRERGKSATENAIRRRPSAASSLLEIADELFETVLLDTGIAAVVPRSGPNVAAPLNDRGPRSARAKLSAEFYEREHRAATQTALAEAIETLSGRAGSQVPVLAWMRVAPYEDGVVVDLGNAEGDAILVNPRGWSVLNRSPVLMYRTSASMPLPVPPSNTDGGLSSIRRLFNFADSQFDLLVAWWVAALVLPDAPVAVLVLSGPGGVAKSTATEFAVQLIDPSAVPRRAIAHQRDFHVVTGATRVVPVENVSSVPKWLSDRISAAVTGDGQLLRTLFETTGITVVSYRRVFTMNGVGLAEAISAADLVDRVMIIEPQPIPEDKRLTERELREAFSRAHPMALAELLETCVRTLRLLPSVQLDRAPRMADFARVLVAVDSVRGTRTFETYLEGREAMGDTLLAEGAFGGELLALLERDATLNPDRTMWTLETSASQLRAYMADHLGPRDVPPVNQVRHEVDLVRPQLTKEGWYFDVVKSGRRRRYRFRKEVPAGARAPTAGTAGTAQSDASKHPANQTTPPPVNDVREEFTDVAQEPASGPSSSPVLDGLIAQWHRKREQYREDSNKS
jgi:hypothetical protein